MKLWLYIDINYWMWSIGGMAGEVGWKSTSFFF